MANNNLDSLREHFDQTQCRHVDPRLVALIEETEREQWLFMKDLREDDLLAVRTEDARFNMRVIDPEHGMVCVSSDGAHIMQEAQGIVMGTTLTGTGTMLKLGGIAAGLSIVLKIIGEDELPREFILAPTEEVHVNGVRVLPKD